MDIKNVNLTVIQDFHLILVTLPPFSSSRNNNSMNSSSFKFISVSCILQTHTLLPVTVITGNNFLLFLTSAFICRQQQFVSNNERNGIGMRLRKASIECEWRIHASRSKQINCIFCSCFSLLFHSFFSLIFPFCDSSNTYPQIAAIKVCDSSTTILRPLSWHQTRRIPFLRRPKMDIMNIITSNVSFVMSWTSLPSMLLVTSFSPKEEFLSFLPSLILCYWNLQQLLPTRFVVDRLVNTISTLLLLLSLSPSLTTCYCLR